MIPLKVKIVGFEQVRAKIRQLETVVAVGTHVGINRGLETLKTNANEELTRQVNFGRSPTRPMESIFNNWKIEKAKAEGGSIQGILGNMSEHAAMVEFGTASYRTEIPYGPGTQGGMITSQGPWPLHFVGQEGEDVYAWKVKGQEPKRYLTLGMNTSRDMIRDDIQIQIRNKVIGAFS